jgi:hypothetical protein
MRSSWVARLPGADSLADVAQKYEGSLGIAVPQICVDEDAAIAGRASGSGFWNG